MMTNTIDISGLIFAAISTSLSLILAYFQISFISIILVGLFIIHSPSFIFKQEIDRNLFLLSMLVGCSLTILTISPRAFIAMTTLTVLCKFRSSVDPMEFQND